MRQKAGDVKSHLLQHSAPERQQAADPWIFEIDQRGIAVLGPDQLGRPISEFIESRRRVPVLAQRLPVAPAGARHSQDLVI